MAGLSEFDSGFAFMNVATTTSSPKTEDLPLPNEIRCQLIIASLFTVVGGYLDAFSFLAYDHVFANAQTGNVVLFAVFASAGDWSHAARYLPPIAAFACGVSVAELSGVHLTKHSFRATLLCQGIELIVISVLAALGPWYPTQYMVPTISFAVGLQITSFDAIGPWLFNSAMMTANIRPSHRWHCSLVYRTRQATQWRTGIGCGHDVLLFSFGSAARWSLHSLRQGLRPRAVRRPALYRVSSHLKTTEKIAPSQSEENTRCRTVLKSGLERIWGFMPPRPAPAMNLWATTRCICPVRRCVAHSARIDQPRYDLKTGAVRRTPTFDESSVDANDHLLGRFIRFSARWLAAYSTMNTKRLRRRTAICHRRRCRR